MTLPGLKKALKVTDATKRFVNAALKSGVAKGVLVKNKGKYKVSKEAKKPAKVSGWVEREGASGERGAASQGTSFRVARPYLVAAPGIVLTLLNSPLHLPCRCRVAALRHPTPPTPSRTSSRTLIDRSWLDSSSCASAEEEEGGFVKTGARNQF